EVGSPIRQPQRNPRARRDASLAQACGRAQHALLEAAPVERCRAIRDRRPARVEGGPRDQRANGARIFGAVALPHGPVLSQSAGPRGSTVTCPAARSRRWGSMLRCTAVGGEWPWHGAKSFGASDCCFLPRTRCRRAISGACCRRASACTLRAWG